MGNYNRNSNRNNNGNNNNNNNNQKKHSGCSEKMGSNGKMTIYGWNFSKSRGLVKFVAQSSGKFAGEGKNSSMPVDDNKEMFIVTVTFLRDGTQKTMNGILRHDKKKMYIPNLGMVANPKAPNGGYFGSSAKPKR